VAAYYEHGNEVLGYTNMGNYLPVKVLHPQEGPYSKELEGILKVHHWYIRGHRRDYITDRLYYGQVCKTRYF